MSGPSALAFAGIQHECLRAHLFPGDGLEAAAILLCSRSAPPRIRLLVREIILVPHAACSTRRADSLTWPGHYIEQALDRAETEDLTVVPIHSHPGGYFAFSESDDVSDRGVMAGLLQNHGHFHGSAIMVPNGAVRARWYGHDIQPKPIELVAVAGHDLLYWWEGERSSGHRPMAFTSDMRRELGRLTAGFIGVSGTGSVSAEQGCRLGFGRVKLIDFDRVELKNLTRILNSTLRDARTKRLKVEAFAEAVSSYRGEGVAEAIPLSIMTRDAVIAAGQCDVLFCGVDSLEARQIADLISIAFLLPLFDVGVVIPVRDAGGVQAIGDVCGRIDYVQPGRSTLGDRGIYTPESLRAEYLQNTAPDAHREEVQEGYLPGVIDEAPAVITLNMRAASACIARFPVMGPADFTDWTRLGGGVGGAAGDDV